MIFLEGAPKSKGLNFQSELGKTPPYLGLLYGSKNTFKYRRLFFLVSSGIAGNRLMGANPIPRISLVFFERIMMISPHYHHAHTTEVSGLVTRQDPVVVSFFSNTLDFFLFCGLLHLQKCNPHMAQPVADHSDQQVRSCLRPCFYASIAEASTSRFRIIPRRHI